MSFIGKTHTLETRRNFSKARRGKRRSVAYVEKVRARMRGNTLWLGRHHSEETKEKMRRAQTGKHHSEETKKKMRIAKQKHLRNSPPGCRCVPCRGGAWPPTKIEGILQKIVLAEFPFVEQYKRFGKYTVDAYLPPPYHLAFEADGEPWHSWPARQEFDRQRDIELFEKFNLPVVRLTGNELLQIAAKMKNIIS